MRVNFSTMKQGRTLKYLLPLTVYVAAILSFRHSGWICFLPLVYAFVMIPLLELIIPPDVSNPDDAEVALMKKNPLYDWFLYIIVPLQWWMLYTFLLSVSASDTADMVTVGGRTLSMGLLCGVFGINVGHELGHRLKRSERILAQILLLTSLYMHFYIEHNKGHHRNVATREDPSSARWGEALYPFWIRTLFFSYLSAWKIAVDELRKSKLPFVHYKNRMLLFQVVQLLLLVIIGYWFGKTALLLFLGAAFMGILLLETVNYIEHYGLERVRRAEGHYERVQPHHSWNSNHVIGRLMLFELSRHSDHHYLASRKYPFLKHHEASPQMPTGYPGMMLLSLVPPLWFRVMNPRIGRLQKNLQKLSPTPQ